MKIIEPYAHIVPPMDGRDMLRHIEWAGRTCYKSETKITEGSEEKFVRGLIERGHESVLEHCSFSARIICDRGVSHELVRHRLTSVSQESTRYCNYSKKRFGEEITVIRPPFWEHEWDNRYITWRRSCEAAEQAYFQLLDAGATPQEARAVLPMSLKTELVMTCNLREWRAIFKLRTSTKAHPQIVEIMKNLLADAKESIPVVFDDIYEEVHTIEQNGSVGQDEADV